MVCRASDRLMLFLLDSHLFRLQNMHGPVCVDRRLSIRAGWLCDVAVSYQAYVMPPAGTGPGWAATDCIQSDLTCL